MKRAVLVVALIGGLVLVGGLIWWLTQRAHEAPELVLHGNGDLRQGELAFNNSERIAAFLLQDLQQRQFVGYCGSPVPPVLSPRFHAARAPELHERAA